MNIKVRNLFVCVKDKFHGKKICDMNNAEIKAMESFLLTNLGIENVKYIEGGDGGEICSSPNGMDVSAVGTNEVAKPAPAPKAQKKEQPSQRLVKTINVRGVGKIDLLEVCDGIMLSGFEEDVANRKKYKNLQIVVNGNVNMISVDNGNVVVNGNVNTADALHGSVYAEQVACTCPVKQWKKC